MPEGPGFVLLYVLIVLVVRGAGHAADDGVAAMREARRLAGARAGRVGYQAGSQGGWVAPIAANRAPVDFVIVCFGLAVSVIDEDQQQVEIEMRDKVTRPK